MQGLELLVTVLLARSRPPPPPVAPGVPRNELAAELISLPSGLLAMVCEAMMKLKVRLASCLGVRFGCVGHLKERADEVPKHVHGARQSMGGSPLGVVRPYANY